MTPRPVRRGGATTAERLGGTLLVVGLWAGVGWLVFRLVWPGPTPALTLETPPTEGALALDTPLRVRGRVARATALTCQRRQIPIGPDGRFEAALPGPTRPGMYLVSCTAENERGRRYPFPYARLAGRTRPLGEPIPDAVLVAVPLRTLTARGGLLGPLAGLIATQVAPPVIAAARKFTATVEGATLGPIRIGGLTLLRVEASGPETLLVTVGLDRVELDLDIPEGWVPKGLPAAVRRFLPSLAGKRTLALGRQLPVSVTVSWPEGARPRLSVGLLSSELLRSAFKLRFLADTFVGALGGLSKRWQADLDKALNETEAVIQALDQVHRGLETRLTRVGSLLPPLPAFVSPARPAVCFRLSLTKLRARPEDDLVTLHLAAQILGVTTGGRRCADARPGEIRPVPLGRHLRQRLVLGPPAPSNGLARPALLVGHDLVNAYLATLWAAGTLDRVPIRLPEVKAEGFDVRHLAYRLPPVLTTGPDGRLLFEVPELGVELGTLGEPARLFAAHLALPLGLTSPRPGRLRFGIERSAPPKVVVRCEREAAGNGGAGADGAAGCPAQSRRFQSLVNVATELAFRPELATPPLAVEAALPALEAAGVTLRIGRVAPVPRGVQVELDITAR